MPPRYSREITRPVVLGAQLKEHDEDDGREEIQSRLRHHHRAVIHRVEQDGAPVSGIETRKSQDHDADAARDGAADDHDEIEW